MRRRSAVIFACCCALMAFATVTVSSPMAAQRKANGQALPFGTKEPSRIVAEQPEQQPKKQSAQPMPKRWSKAGSTANSQGQPGLKPVNPKAHRVIKAHKKATPKAVVQPRTDLIHYGVLKDAQRYDPRPHTDSGAVRSPQTPELTHDHFQELDRNQDGMVDPVERAFGRIDMDRDLHSRTLQ